jgi:hypothetical protein
MGHRFILFSVVPLLTLSCCQNIDKSKDEGEPLIATIDGFKYITDPPCALSSNHNVAANLSHRLDTNLYSYIREVCRNDTIDVLNHEIVFLWKSKEYAQPNKPIGFNEVYPEGTEFLWWGCIDSIIIDSRAYYNPIRSSAMPSYSKIFLSLNKRSFEETGDSLLIISVDASVGRSFTGGHFFETNLGTFEFRSAHE